MKAQSFIVCNFVRSHGRSIPKAIAPARENTSSRKLETMQLMIDDNQNERIFIAENFNRTVADDAAQCTSQIVYLD